MSSSTRNVSKAELKRQIEALQAQLAQQPASPKRRKTDGATVLAPATPSPRKKTEARRERAQSPTDFARRIQQTRLIPPLKTNVKTKSTLHARAAAPEPSAPSSLISQLKLLSTNKKDDSEPVARTEGFAEKPMPPTTDVTKAPVRDERLAIVEELELGPAEHKPITDDPKFEKVEPNSGIRLKSRVLSHSALQDHLSGRYFLPPSLLYSVVRLQQNKQAYEVPVEGDWVTIAVVAERGNVKLTSGPGNAAHGKRGDEDELDEGRNKDKKTGTETDSKSRKGADDDDEENPRKGGKKYVHLKLIDLGLRSRSSSSASSRASLRGDAQLSLLLFESDYFDKLIQKERGKEKVQKLWRGGSGGAFEECFSRLREGTVIALLNPKVLKPFQNTKNPTSSSILALTPPSASAIAIIGYASDLGMCTVLKRDGKPCGAWVDKRANLASSTSKAEDVCEYHIQNAVQRARAGRAEFSIGTSGMSTTAHKRRPVYDPARQWGLKPDAGARGPGGEATYVIGGHVASSARAQAPGVAGEMIGREGQARARRRTKERDGDRELAELLGNGSTGAVGGKGVLDVVLRAREAVVKEKEKEKHPLNDKGKGKAVDADENDSDGRTPLCEQAQPKRKKYSADMVKRLGFDPTLNAYGAHAAGAGKQGAKSKNASAKLGNLADQKRKIQLGPPPGTKVRSGVVAPSPSSVSSAPNAAGGPNDASDSAGQNSLVKTGREATHVRAAKTGAGSESDSDLEIEPPMLDQKTVPMAKNRAESSDLEIEPPIAAQEENDELEYL